MLSILGYKDAKPKQPDGGQGTPEGGYHEAARPFQACRRRGSRAIFGFVIFLLTLTSADDTVLDNGEVALRPRSGLLHHLPPARLTYSRST